MSVVKDTKRNTWTTRFYKRDSVTGQLKLTSKRGFKTKDEAKKYELAYKGTSKAITNTFYDVYLEYLRTLTCSDEEKHTRTTYIDKYVPFKESPIVKVNKHELVDFSLSMKDCGLAPVTINKIFSAVRGTFKYAYDIYDVKDIGYLIKNIKIECKEKDILTIDEFNRMIECETNPIFYAFFYTAYWTGARRGELRALEKSDLKDHYLTIRQTMRRTQDSLKEGNKTSKMIKTIYLDEQTYQLCFKLALRQGKWLFGDEFPLPNETINRRLKNDLKQAHINKHITMHNLRHSHGSILLANGVDIANVSKRLGHSSITTTLQNYIHLLDDDGKVTIEAIEKIKGN